MWDKNYTGSKEVNFPPWRTLMLRAAKQAQWERAAVLPPHFSVDTLSQESLVFFGTEVMLQHGGCLPSSYCTYIPMFNFPWSVAQPSRFQVFVGPCQTTHLPIS